MKIKTHLSEVVDESIIVPHVLLWQVGTPLTVPVFRLNCIVTQMNTFMEIINLEWLGTKSRQKHINVIYHKLVSYLRYEDLYIQITKGFQSVTKTHCLISNFVPYINIGLSMYFCTTNLKYNEKVMKVVFF